LSEAKARVEAAKREKQAQEFENAGMQKQVDRARQALAASQQKIVDLNRKVEKVVNDTEKAREVCGRLDVQLTQAKAGMTSDVREAESAKTELADAEAKVRQIKQETEAIAKEVAASDQATEEEKEMVKTALRDR
jgi:chromosome segregation ATPase